MYCVLVQLRHNVQLCGLRDQFVDAMIHMYRVLLLPGLVANVRSGMHLDFLHNKYSVLIDEISLISVCILNHHYIGYHLHPS